MLSHLDKQPYFIKAWILSVEVGYCQALNSMQVRTKIYILAFFISAVFWQCTETKEVNPSSLGTKYFPLEVGDYRIYSVSGVEYISTLDSIEFSYMLKESVVDSFTNLESGVSFKMQREKKYTEEGTWEIDSIWTARKDQRIAVQVENNVPYIKLSFPISDSLKWDGNGLNDKNLDEYLLVSVGQTFSSDIESYSNTATVIQEYIPDLIVNWISKKEIYAKEIGLVYKENEKIDFRTEPEFLNLGVIKSGIKYYQHLVEYGKE